MKLLQTVILLASLGLVSSRVQAQDDCAALIVDNRVINQIHILKSQAQTLVVRGSYSYAITLMSDDKGITALMESKGGIEFNQGDEVIFMDANRTRRSYRFTGMGEMLNEGGIPVYTNYLQLAMTAAEWFANSKITTIYLKNNISNEMRKFTLTQSRLQEFNALAACFYQLLDPTKVVDKGKAGFLLPSSGNSTRTTSAVTANHSDAGIAAASGGAGLPSTDAELERLRQDLHTTKEQLRAEIAAERARAEQIKRNLQEEVAAAREQAAAEKKR
ncbi:MAG: hypothetical protein D6772_05905, partial [Bacteroidetes bacterium]